MSAGFVVVVAVMSVVESDFVAAKPAARSAAEAAAAVGFAVVVMPDFVVAVVVMTDFALVVYSDGSAVFRLPVDCSDQDLDLTGFVTERCV